MKRYLIPCLAAAFTVGLVGCGNDNSTPPGTGLFRAVNGIPDSSSIGVAFEAVSTGAVGFPDASGVNTVPKGSGDATITPSGQQSFKVTGVPIDEDNVSTVVTYGTVAAGTVAGFKTEESISAPSSGSNFAVQFVHGAYAASQTVSTVNFYILEPGQTVSQVTPTTVTFGQSPGRVEFPISSTGYELVIKTQAGVTLYDSGTGAALVQNGANVLQIFALDAGAGAPGASALAVLVADNKGGHFTVAPLTAP